MDLIKLADCTLEHTFLVFDDPWSCYGKAMLLVVVIHPCADLTLRCVHYMSLYKSKKGGKDLKGCEDVV